MTGPTPEDIARLETEKVSAEFAALDRMSALEIVTTMNRKDATIPPVIARALPEIAQVVDAATASLRAGGRLVYAGCGTAGRLGVLDASECPPTFGTDPSTVIGLIAGGDAALRTAVEGSEDDEPAGAADIAALGVGPSDTVVGIAASGRTPYTVAAVRRARQLGAATAALVCTAGSPLAHAADIPLEVVTGPEVVAGSTRLSAGTAQKLVLNMISTATMVRLGKTFGNRMVDVRATNAKLEARAVTIVSDIADVDLGAARRALAEAGGEAKTAALMLMAGVDALAARERLRSAEGSLRAALGPDPSPAH